jgi:hypothetical protein
MLRITAGGALLCVTESGSASEQCRMANQDHPQLFLSAALWSKSHPL